MGDRFLDYETDYNARHNPPYANCFAAALAEAREATLVTTDKDFGRAGTALKTLWV